LAAHFPMGGPYWATGGMDCLITLRPLLCFTKILVFISVSSANFGSKKAQNLSSEEGWQRGHRGEGKGETGNPLPPSQGKLLQVECSRILRASLKISCNKTRAVPKTEPQNWIKWSGLRCAHIPKSSRHASFFTCDLLS
jgi:hypothetical protein